MGKANRERQVDLLVKVQTGAVAHTSRLFSIERRSYPTPVTPLCQEGFSLLTALCQESGRRLRSGLGTSHRRVLGRHSARLGGNQLPQPFGRQHLRL